LSAVTPADLDEHRPTPEAALALRPARLFDSAVWLCSVHVVTRYLLPAPLRVAWTLWRIGGFLLRGLRSLLRLELDVAVLDAAAMVVCVLRLDFSTASSTAFLIQLSELIEDQTRRHSEQQLIASLLQLPEKASRVAGSEEELVDAAELVEGDVIVVRTGQALPVDGVVLNGQAWVNQSTLTGEAAAVLRERGDDVFAGTALEDGELFVRVSAAPERTRLRSIVGMVQLSESLKSGAQQSMERLANRIVPLNLMFAAGVFAVTRSLERLSAALTVDYSCALRLTGSVTSLAALREAAGMGLRVKGSRCLEMIAQADTLVFDKTGTLTQATPSVAAVLPLDDWDETEVLRLAACLEEHFPHPVARAVVEEARRRGVNHRERHAEVEFIVAHGIASTLEGQRAIIGSGHFVFEDEGIAFDAEKLTRLHDDFPDASPLFLAVGGQLVGALMIRDPLRPQIASTLQRLRAAGFARIVMLTGDNARTAAVIAREAGIDQFEADLLPDDKQLSIQCLKAEGAAVVMVGDGVNDSPALSCADVGIAMETGAAIAREVADITLTSDNLESLLVLRQLGQSLQTRTQASYKTSVAINTALLLAASTGLITASTASLLHNGTTAALCASGTRNYLSEGRCPYPVRHCWICPGTPQCGR
ncbi:MAG: heavy metal translocating P-type ATPase, partial [Coriobacteriales bacterium]|jgi:heavy metal translocating P-type ATPase|nr:heavy metal translocating P-type ATPase [Coriobacteriales bacterium]